MTSFASGDVCGLATVGIRTVLIFFFLSSTFFSVFSLLKKAFAFCSATRRWYSVAVCRMNVVCVSTIRVTALSPHARMTEAGREMQAASAAHVKILLFIESKQPSAFFNLAVVLANKQSQP